MFLLYLTLHKNDKLCYLPLNCATGSEKNRLCGWIIVGVRSDVPLPLHMLQPCLPLVDGFVNDALRNMVPSVNEFASARQCRVLVFV